VAQVVLNKFMKKKQAESQKENMNQSDVQLQQVLTQLDQLRQNLRTVRHSINNHVAVMMAMAELAQRNPTQCARLAQVCLDKAPQIAQSIRSFSEAFDVAVNLQEQIAKEAAPKS
jgi:hypothetical protein